MPPSSATTAVSTAYSVFLFLSFLLLLRSARVTPTLAYLCGSDAKNETEFSPNSTYQSNLNYLLSKISFDDSTHNRPFRCTAVGVDDSNPHAVYGLSLCRGDVATDVCQECVDTARVEIVRTCARVRSAIIWYDECMLRYSDQYFFPNDIFSIQFNSSKSIAMLNTGNITDPNRFAQLLNDTMSKIVTRAATDQSPPEKFATAEANFSGFQTLYTLAQCTPNMSSSDCRGCLGEAVAMLADCCGGKQGGRVLRIACYVRFEMYPFYNESVGAAAPASAPGPIIPRLLPPGVAASPREDGDKSQDVQLPDLGVGRLMGVGCSRENFQENNQMKFEDFPVIQLDLICTATQNFSNENKIGEGGFGPVYKGLLMDGKEIAVKRLSRTSGQGLKEFKNEVNLIARLQHRNLVRLLGCCFEAKELLLIYEYMPNKSLDFFLFDSTKVVHLDWKICLNIINGIARGLLYLHEDSRLKIIHRDLKASNILLDYEMNPKISDFGMARIFCGNQNEANTNRVVGTYGYMAPEYAMEGLFSIKSDVFSFGVIILEIVSGKRNGGFHLSDTGQSLLTYAWNLWSEGRGLDLMNSILVQSYVATEVLKWIHIGLLCVQEDPTDRPAMSSVVVMLASDALTLPQPTKPAFSVGRDFMRYVHSQPSNKVGSINEVTFSSVLPR
ncbi:cysteine-rich receptor-like protein kinase 15 isoform X2 [Malania oleifera]|uniref:cysteine-rich receptor-like protein kinase 15 isoform X2 n=1 Tax=Malania oleifera TaxID=397392 RepID=UPI0025AE3FF0|nr:cysteine-rich receptor-like protein kinase 15 isoform X2 [Malania oleifera]